jgi:hypothetical protein
MIIILLQVVSPISQEFKDGLFRCIPADNLCPGQFIDDILLEVLIDRICHSIKPVYKRLQKHRMGMLPVEIWAIVARIYVTML